MSHPSPIRIRPAAATDETALGRLGALLVAVHHGFDQTRFLAPGPETEHIYGSFLIAEAERPQKLVLVAEEAGEVFGYAYAGLEGHDWKMLRGPAGVIYDLVVDPGCRHEGIGRLLLERMLETLEERGAPRAVLFTATHNENARKLFASAGFRPTMTEMTRDWPGASQEGASEGGSAPDQA